MQKSTLPESQKRTKSAHKAQIILAVFAFVIAVAVWLWWSYATTVEDTQELVIADTEVTVEIADTQDAREKGLSGRDDLSDGQGMLFVFDNPGLYSFHMQDMEFAIDIIWLDESRRVVDIVSDVSPDTYPQTFSSSSAAKYVLEVPAGFSNEHDLARGMSAEW